MTLLELAVVVAIIGMLGVMAAALDASQARRRAISTGDNHLLRFSFSGSNATQYGLYRRTGGSTTLVDEVHPVPSSVTVTTAGTTDMEFIYTGEALASYTITIVGPDRTWTVTVPQVTGKSRVPG
jgi:hypothetical protein